jgi:hypothetical protein
MFTAGDSAGPVIAGLYSYYNSAYGQIQADGPVKLTYQGTPVWLFRAPLALLVDASTATLMTDWEHCTGS